MNSTHTHKFLMILRWQPDEFQDFRWVPSLKRITLSQYITMHPEKTHTTNTQIVHRLGVSLPRMDAAVSCVVDTSGFLVPVEVKDAPQYGHLVTKLPIFLLKMFSCAEIHHFYIVGEFTQIILDLGDQAGQNGGMQLRC